MNQEICFLGWGTVSPWGWGMSDWPQGEIWDSGEVHLPLSEQIRPGWEKPISVRKVPDPATPLPFRRHPRFRRVSSISKFAAASMLEAISNAGETDLIHEENLRVGVIFTVMSGSVNYSRRFYEEVLEDPSVASPLLFPETVFNAPSSHLSTYLGVTSPNYTLVGDSSVWALGLAMGAEWLTEGRVDRVLVVASEELDWLTADAFRKFSRECVVAEGATAVLLGPGTTEVKDSGSVCLLDITNPVPLVGSGGRQKAVAEVRENYRDGVDPENCLLVDGRQGVSHWDESEEIAWADWRGSRFSPKKWTGEALTASVGWQTALAARSIQQGRFDQAIISSPGINHQAIGIRLGRMNDE